jgi:hypothetical protein
MAVHAHRPRPTRVADRSAPRSWGVGAAAAMLAAGGLVLSMLLPWRQTDMYPRAIPVEFLWNRDASTSEPSLLVVLVPLAVLLVIGALVPGGAWLRLLAGLGTLLVVGVFAFQLNRVVDGTPGFGRGTTFDTGFYVAALAGIGAFVSGLLTSRSSRWRHTPSRMQS